MNRVTTLIRRRSLLRRWAELSLVILVLTTHHAYANCPPATAPLTKATVKSLKLQIEHCTLKATLDGEAAHELPLDLGPGVCSFVELKGQPQTFEINGATVLIAVNSVQKPRAEWTASTPDCTTRLRGIIVKRGVVSATKSSQTISACGRGPRDALMFHVFEADDS